MRIGTIKDDSVTHRLMAIAGADRSVATEQADRQKIRESESLQQGAWKGAGFLREAVYMGLLDIANFQQVQDLAELRRSLSPQHRRAAVRPRDPLLLRTRSPPLTPKWCSWKPGGGGCRAGLHYQYVPYHRTLRTSLYASAYSRGVCHLVLLIGRLH